MNASGTTPQTVLLAGLLPQETALIRRLIASFELEALSIDIADLHRAESPIAEKDICLALFHVAAAARRQEREIRLLAELLPAGAADRPGAAGPGEKSRPISRPGPMITASCPSTRTVFRSVSISCSNGARPCSSHHGRPTPGTSTASRVPRTCGAAWSPVCRKACPFSPPPRSFSMRRTTGSFTSGARSACWAAAPTAMSGWCRRSAARNSPPPRFRTRPE